MTAALAVACGVERDERRNLLLISIDTLRVEPLRPETEAELRALGYLDTR